MDTILFNKPYGVLTRFTDPKGGRPTLADYIELPGVYPVGRLDFASEGLLVLTSRSEVVEPLLRPGGKLKRYLVCVEGEPTEERLARLRAGVSLGDGPSRFESVSRLDEEPARLWPRPVPIRYRRSVPVFWLEVALREGRNRQVRRTTAAVGLPTLRLIRVGFGPFELGELPSGSWRALLPEEEKSLAEVTGSGSRLDSPGRAGRGHLAARAVSVRKRGRARRPSRDRT